MQTPRTGGGKSPKKKRDHCSIFVYIRSEAPRERLGRGATRKMIENVTRTCASNIETLHRRSFPMKIYAAWAYGSAGVDHSTRCSMLWAFHRAKCGGSATGGAPLAQPSRATTIVTNALRGRKSCLWLVHALGPRSSRAQIHLGACLTAPMSTTSNVNATQREDDKRLERRAWSSIIAFHLVFDSPQRTCRTFKNPVTTRTSSVKVGRPVTNSKRGYSLPARMILRANLK
jgi:hypothetical protein